MNSFSYYLSRRHSSGDKSSILGGENNIVEGRLMISGTENEMAMYG